MNSDDLANQLHDKTTRGELLSTEEQFLLDNWYALQDRAESNTIGLMKDEMVLTTLQMQVEATLTQLTIVTKRIQEIASENEALKLEITRLHQRLVYQPSI